MNPVQILLQRVPFVNDLHLRLVVLHVEAVVGARVDRVGRVGLESGRGAFIEHLDQRSEVGGAGVEVAVGRAAEIGEPRGAEGVSEHHLDLHELGHLGALRAIQDGLLLLRQLHLVLGRLFSRGIGHRSSRERGLLTRRLAVGPETLHVGRQHILRVVRDFGCSGSSGG